MADFFEPDHRRRPLLEPVERPAAWRSFYKNVRPRWLIPLAYIDWLSQWAIFGLSRISLFGLLEYCGSLSILIAVIFYFVQAPERTKMKHYQAWQVINTAQGKGGSGGRIDALHELNEDKVPLVGVDLSDSFLQNIVLEHADLRRSDFRGADLKRAKLGGSDFEQSGLRSANLREADFAGTNLDQADLEDADMTNASLRAANVRGARFDRADLRGVDLEGIMNWKELGGVRLADIHGVRNAPGEFMAWAINRGAVDVPNDEDWERKIEADAATRSSKNLPQNHLQPRREGK